MVYRPTEHTQARKAEVRLRILDVTRRLVATGGFGRVQISDVAKAAGIATGTVYRYFPSKPELFAEVFRLAAQREVDHVQDAADAPGPAVARLANALTMFTRRAVRGRRLAYSLLAEPIDPAIETERLRFRRSYDALFRRLIGDGIAAGEFLPQDEGVVAAAIVGALAEALVGPLTPDSALDDDAIDRRAQAIIAFCLRALTGRNDVHADYGPAFCHP